MNILFLDNLPETKSDDYYCSPFEESMASYKNTGGFYDLRQDHTDWVAVSAGAGAGYMIPAIPLHWRKRALTS